jgi:NAD(P)-dependent dehydrogenase (short-subunit alcohol dehydrogenase family)
MSKHAKSNFSSQPKAQTPVVIITGATGGIGMATAQKFLQQGWIVVGTTHQSTPPEQLKATIDWQPADLADPGSLTALVSRTVDTYGHIDALVSNAGYGLTGPVEELTFDRVERQLQVNVVGAIHLIAQVLRVMKRQGKGAIIITSSIAGRVGIPGFAAYSASNLPWRDLPKPCGMSCQMVLRWR